MPLSVIGAGLGRTGTLSLKLALEQLGFGPCYHMAEVFKNPAAPGYWAAVADGERADWEMIFEGYRSTVDWPSSTFYQRLAEAYPDAKVVLTVRDPEAWFASTQATIFAREHTAGEVFENMFRKVIGEMFEQRLHDRAWAISVFERHNEEVRQVIPAERLLTYEVAQGWAPLCLFLGVPIPDGPMPKVNSTQEFQARVSAVAAASAKGAAAP